MGLIALGLILLMVSPNQRPSFSGEWSGTTSQNHPIIVTIIGNQIISVYIEAEIGTRVYQGYNITDFTCPDCSAHIDEHGDITIEHSELVMNGEFTGQGINGTYELSVKTELFNKTTEIGTFTIENALQTQRVNTALTIYPIFIGICIGMLIVGGLILYFPNRKIGPKVITVKKKGSYKPQP